MPERVRASRIKSGLTCEGVRLCGAGKDVQCCNDCHQSTTTMMAMHAMMWVECPTTQLSPNGWAQVCCKLRRRVADAYHKGKWPESKDFTVETLMTKQFVEHPAWVSSHLPKVVAAKFFDGPIQGTSHKVARYLELHVPGMQDLQEVLCCDAECKQCGASLHLYWSYVMQAWVPMKRYGIIDNAFNLSPKHDAATKCEVPGHVQMHQVIHVPEYAAYLCKTLHASSHQQYLMNPMFGAAVFPPDSLEGVKYVVHLVAGPVSALKEMAEIVPLIQKVVNH